MEQNPSINSFTRGFFHEVPSFSHVAAWRRLLKYLQVQRHGFHLHLLVYSDSVYRHKLIDKVAERHPEATILSLTAADAPRDWRKLEQRLRDLSARHSLIHLTEMEAWRKAKTRLELFSIMNLRRDSLAEACRVPLLIWLRDEETDLLAAQAPDVWAWRTGVFDFQSAGEPLLPQVNDSLSINNANAGPLRKRIQTIDQAIRHEQLSLLGQAMLLEEKGRILIKLGEYRDARESLGLALHTYSEELHDQPRAAQAKLGLAKLERFCENWGDSLRLARESLDIFESLGDRKGAATAKGRIADILQARGELDKALRMRREEVLPVFQELGDARAEAVTKGKMADILQALGNPDEALRMRRKEVLPVFEKMGDIRAVAVTKGKMADILEASGNLDEALRIRREELLPVFQKLGDARAEAVTKGMIADILQARGELDKALRIRREEELPVYQKLGDIRAESVTKGKIAGILARQGKLDEAILIRQKATIPIAKQLGSMRDLMVHQTNLALLLLQRKSSEEDERQANDLLREAHRLAQELNFPVEEKQIAAILRGLGLLET